MTVNAEKPPSPPANPPRPLHTRKSAWKLGWPARQAGPQGCELPAQPAH